METGKWIALAFLAGAVLVGFKTRSLKWYEFTVSGLFLLLVDRLVFKGQISDWIGQLGSNVQGTAATHGSAGMAVMVSATTRARARQFCVRLWRHRPGFMDYIATAVITVVAHEWLGWGWPAAIGVVATVLAGLTVVTTLMDLTTPDTADAAEVHTESTAQAGVDERAGGGVVTALHRDQAVDSDA